MGRSLSTFKIAQLLDVNPSSVSNWVDQKLLEAHRTPGGHRRVAITELLRFLKERNMPVPPELQSPLARVLVVDDEPALCRLIARSLRLANPEYEVVEATDGFSAGQLVASMNPDVVILDLRMPGIDGFEVCRIIKSQDRTRHAVVLAMTAFPSQESEQQIRECGADAFFSKPLDMDKLLAAVQDSV
ncbi:MAG: response regulator [Planctomycetes bacterium]|nr:response regulator [Planctomycetota bacterium]